MMVQQSSQHPSPIMVISQNRTTLQFWSSAKPVWTHGQSPCSFRTCTWLCGGQKRKGGHNVTLEPSLQPCISWSYGVRGAQLMLFPCRWAIWGGRRGAGACLLPRISREAERCCSSSHAESVRGRYPLTKYFLLPSHINSLLCFHADGMHQTVKSIC